MGDIWKDCPLTEITEDSLVALVDEDEIESLFIKTDAFDRACKNAKALDPEASYFYCNPTMQLHRVRCQRYALRFAKFREQIEGMK